MGVVWNFFKRECELTDNLSLAPRWAAFEEVRQRVEGSVIGELLPLTMKGEIAFADLGAAFKRAFYQNGWVRSSVTVPSFVRFIP